MDPWDILEAPAEGADACADDPLQVFLRQVEVALLAIEFSSPSPSLPHDVPADCVADCEALLHLIDFAKSGDFASVLASPWLAPFKSTLSGAESLPRLHMELIETCKSFTQAAAAGAAASRGLGILIVAIASLQMYLRANWTGPPVEAGDEVASDYPLGRADATADAIPLGVAIQEALEADGEPLYELIGGPGYLWLTSALLGILSSRGPASTEENADTVCSLATGITLPIWCGRCAFAWQLSLADASERGCGQSAWLYKLSVCDLVKPSQGTSLLECLLEGKTFAAVQAVAMPVLHTWRNSKGRLVVAPGPPTVLSVVDTTGLPTALEAEASGVEESDNDSRALRATLSLANKSVCAALLVEFGVRLSWYGRVKAFEPLLEAACAQLGFNFEITGVMGIKRKYQTVEFAQLVVKASTSDSAVPPPPLDGSEDTDAGPAVPGNLKLTEVDDMTDVLEVPKFAESVDDDIRALVDKPLNAAEQLILLCKCNYVWVTGNPNDEMLLQNVNALAQRVLVAEEKPVDENPENGPMMTANWLTFSCGLYYRCRAEHHRNRTRERAAFQLQALVEQFKDEKPSSRHRLLLVHGAGYPARFHLQRENGVRMMRMGMVSTAHEEFKKLRMWDEAIDCLMVAGRNVEALDLINGLLEQGPTPRLWCCLGDLEKEPKHFEKAWELSKGRFARAQRSLGRHHFKQGDFKAAIACFAKALDINPMHSDIWFTMGVSQIKLEDYDNAALTFARCLGVNDEDSQAWANLAASHSARGKLQEARNCMVEATKRARTNWKMWESFLGICMQLRDIQGCIQAMSRFVELDQIPRIREKVLGAITVAVVSNQEGLYGSRKGHEFARQLNDFFKRLTDHHASDPVHWRLYAEFQDARGQDASALDCRFKYFRAAKARLFEERDPESFASLLQDIEHCLLTLEKTLSRPCLAKQAETQLQPFAYAVRDIAKQLQLRLDTPGPAPAWAPIQESILALAARAEAQAAAGPAAAADATADAA